MTHQMLTRTSDEFTSIYSVYCYTVYITMQCICLSSVGAIAYYTTPLEM